MMKMPNPRNESLEQLLPSVKERFPDAKIQKIFFAPQSIVIPYHNYKFVVRRKNDVLKIDHTLPVIYALGAILVSVVIVSVIMSLIYGQLMIGLGGALWIILGVVIMKYLFQTIKKNEFETFQTELSTAINRFDFDRPAAGTVVQ